MILSNFLKNCMKLRKFWAIGGMHQGRPLRFATAPSFLPPDIRPGHFSPLLLSCGGDHWRPIQTCSLEDLPLPPHSTDIHWWSQKHIPLASRCFASYWNGVLYFSIFHYLYFLKFTNLFVWLLVFFSSIDHTG